MQPTSTVQHNTGARLLRAASLAITAMAAMAATPAIPNATAAEQGGTAGARWSFSAIAKDTRARHAFDAMARGHQLPAWVKKGVVESPAVAVEMAGRRYQVMQACKPHHCAEQQVAVMYSPGHDAMYGVLLSRSGSSEKLSWLNIGGGSESIDGKTILYAALTGSLANHPQAFDFR